MTVIQVSEGVIVKTVFATSPMNPHEKETLKTLIRAGEELVRQYNADIANARRSTRYRAYDLIDEFNKQLDQVKQIEEGR